MILCDRASAQLRQWSARRIGWHNGDRMTRKTKRKQGQGRRSKPKRVRRHLSEDAESTPIGNGRSGLPVLPNTHDHLVIQRLRTAPVGELAVDRLLRDAPQRVSWLRDALGRVYLEAAKARESSKATKGQLKDAKSALTQLTRAVENLAKVSGQDTLRILLAGPPLDGKKGERELNELASACWKIKMDVARVGLALQSAIETEEGKATKSGERRKRLRTLVDALANWWQSAGGTLASTVDANRRDDGPAVVHSRHGRFLTLAVAVFCKMDVFKESEVEAAVTNVHEERLALGRVLTKPD
jgi:hypothetical protein